MPLPYDVVQPPRVNGWVKVSVPLPDLMKQPVGCCTSPAMTRSLSICHTTAEVSTAGRFVIAPVHTPPAGPA